MKTEQILVVPKAALTPWIKPGTLLLLADQLQEFLTLVQEKAEFHPRYLMETDESYLQIIPYLLCQYQDEFLVLERSAKASEQRLASKWSLGIGGHVRRDDMITGNIIDWSRRELHEEVSIAQEPPIEVVGLVYDPSDEVGRVHLGVIMCAHLPNKEITIKDEHERCFWLSRQELLHETRLETWSRLSLTAVLATVPSNRTSTGQQLEQQ